MELVYGNPTPVAFGQDDAVSPPPGLVPGAVVTIDFLDGEFFLVQRVQYGTAVVVSQDSYHGIYPVESLTVVNGLPDPPEQALPVMAAPLFISLLAAA